MAVQKTPRTIGIVKANLRPDIVLIYDEVSRQARRNEWSVQEYTPTSWYLPPQQRSKALLLQAFFRSLALSAVLKAIHEWRFFFEGGRPRLGRLLDFLGFSKQLDAHPSDAIFILNQRHSAGACLAARVRGIPIITHQHGDYYHERVRLTGALRDIEGPDTIRLVWNEDSRNVIERLTPAGCFRVAGSLKHAAIQRLSSRSRTEPGLVYFETILRDKEKDRSVAELSAKYLAAVRYELACPTYVAPHPMRGAVLEHPAADLLQIYADQGVMPWPHTNEQVEWAVCSDSNALYDLVASGTPCLHLKRHDSYLPLPDDYPGTIHAQENFISRARELMAVDGRARLQQAQLAFLQEHKIGSPATVERCFSQLFAELAGSIAAN